MIVEVALLVGGVLAGPAVWRAAGWVRRRSIKLLGGVVPDEPQLKLPPGVPEPTDEDTQLIETFKEVATASGEPMSPFVSALLDGRALVEAHEHAARIVQEAKVQANVEQNAAWASTADRRREACQKIAEYGGAVIAEVENAVKLLKARSGGGRLRYESDALDAAQKALRELTHKAKCGQL